MKITNLKKIPPKDLIVFDLDGTLAETKAPIDREMVGLLGRLLAHHKVAIISGGKYGMFRIQFAKNLKIEKHLLKNLFLFPTTGTTFYRYRHGWKKVYALTLSKQERSKIKKAFWEAFRITKYQHPKKTYGKIIEDRGTQVTFSALGQEVVAMLGKKKGVALKEKWKREHTDTKIKITKALARLLPELEVRAAGHTSIDVTQKGIDKAYGLKQMEKHLHVKIKKMIFIGDAIFPNGNDYAVVKTGVDYVQVPGPEGAKQVIRHLLENNSGRT